GNAQPAQTYIAQHSSQYTREGFAVLVRHDRGRARGSRGGASEGDPVTNPFASLSGIGLHPQHHLWVIERRPKVAWFEVHAEHFMTRGVPREELRLIAADYPLSMHASGLSLGSDTPPSRCYLRRLHELVTRLEPELVCFLDTLALPYTEASLRAVI